MRRVSLLMTTALRAALVVVATGSARAGDKDQYTLFTPTPVDKMRAFNTDRPTKSNVPYTVDAGHFQYEGDLFIYGYDNISTPDTNSRPCLNSIPRDLARAASQLDKPLRKTTLHVRDVPNR